MRFLVIVFIIFLYSCASPMRDAGDDTMLANGKIINQIDSKSFQIKVIRQWDQGSKRFAFWHDIAKRAAAEEAASKGFKKFIFLSRTEYKDGNTIYYALPDVVLKSFPDFQVIMLNGDEVVDGNIYEVDVILLETNYLKTQKACNFISC